MMEYMRQLYRKRCETRRIRSIWTEAITRIIFIMLASIENWLTDTDVPIKDSGMRTG